MENKIKVLYIPADGEATVREIGNHLLDMWDLVGGYIEVVRPFNDDVALVCNEEGRIVRGMQPNLVVNGQVIVGDVFICRTELGPEGEEFASLTDEQIEKYSNMFTVDNRSFQLLIAMLKQ